MKNHGNRVFGTTCLLKGRESEGRKFVVHRGTSNTRVTGILPNGLSDPKSEKVPNAMVTDEQDAADPRRPMSGHDGRTYRRTCVIKGKEAEGRRYIVHPGYGVKVRVIDIDPKTKLASGDSYLIDRSLVDKEKTTNFSTTGTVGQNFAIHIPKDMQDGIKIGDVATIEDLGNHVLIKIPKR